MTESVRTQTFLRQVARRLSGRSDCKQIEFLIGIGYELPTYFTSQHQEVDLKVSNHIMFQPDTFVYRDLHHRSDVDRYRVVDLILKNYFSELILGRDDSGNLNIDISKLVRGVYKYQKSYDGKRRRWVRMLPTRYAK